MALTKTGLTFVSGSTPAINGTNLNKIVGLTDDIVDVIETPSYSDTVEETKEIISLSSNASGKFDATVKGNTVVNLLDDDVAGCESTAGWNPFNVTLELDNSNKLEGANCLKLTALTTSGSIARDILPLLDTTKYYLVSAHLKNNNFSNGFRLSIASIGDVGTIASSFIIDTSYIRVALVLQPSDFDNASNVNLIFNYIGSSAQYGFIDAIQLQEISATEYALGATVSMEKYTYHRGTKPTDKIRLKSVGKNLFDKSISVSEKALVASNNTQQTLTESNISDFIKIKSNTQYTLNKGIGSGTYGHGFYDVNKNFISGIVSSVLGVQTFTTPSNAKFIKLTYYIAEVDVLQLEEGSTATTYEPYTDTQATCPVKLKSVPAIQDEWETDIGKITKNVEEYVLQSGDIDALYTFYANIDRIRIKRPLDSFGYGTVINQRFILDGFVEKTGTFIQDSADNNGYFGTGLSPDNYIYAFVSKGTYASLAEAQADLAGTIIYYQLATPEISYTQPAILNAEPNGTVYVEPYIGEDETAQFYSSGLVLDSSYPLSSLNDIDDINKYDLATGIVTPIDIADLTLVSSTSITISGALASDFYAISYNYNNLSTIGTVEHNFGTNLKAQTNDNTEGLKTLNKAISDLLIYIKNLEDRIIDLETP